MRQTAYIKTRYMALQKAWLIPYTVDSSSKEARAVLREFAVSASCDEMAASIQQVLRDARFRVEQSFDLRSALALVPHCACPHHGTELCDCQYSVMLVYGPASSAPVTVVAHGRDDQCWLALADPPDGRGITDLEVAIVLALAKARLVTVTDDNDAVPLVNAAR